MTPIVDTVRLTEPGRARRLLAALAVWWLAWRAPSAVQTRQRMRIHRAYERRKRRHAWWARKVVWASKARRPLFVAAGFTSFTVGAWHLHYVAGLFTLGLSLWLYDWLLQPRNTR